MQTNKQAEVLSVNQNITHQVQVSSISGNVESENRNVSLDAGVDLLRRKLSSTSTQQNSVIELFELDSLPLGLGDVDDTFTRSMLAARLREEVKQASPSEGREREAEKENENISLAGGSFKSRRAIVRRPLSNNVDADFVPDLAENSSTNDLIPLTFASLSDDRSRRFIWLDNISSMAMSFSLANIWRLPTFIYFNYSGEALIAYVILMTIVGLPLYVLEVSLGQFGQSGIVKLWNAVPLFKGIGVAQLIAGLYQTFYFPTLMTWAFQFGILGMGGWNGCESVSHQNLTDCLCQEPGDSFCSAYGLISEEETCFQNGVLHVDGGNMNFKMLPMLAVVVVLVTLSVSFGQKVMKIILSFSGILTVLLLIAALVLALSHPNNSQLNSNLTAHYGISLLDPSEPWGFGRGEVWYGAMVQVLFSLALGFGTLPSQSSSSYFFRNAVWEGTFMWLANMLFAIISVITTFAWIGISGLDAAGVVKTNAFIYFVYYNISSSLWAGLAFGLIFFSGINSMLPLLYAIWQNLCESFPLLEKRYRKWTCLFLFIILWIINIPGLIPAGNEVVTVWDHYAAGGVALSCLIVHMIGWLWVYGGNNLMRDLQFMFARPISFLWFISWSFVTILILIIAELWGFFGVPLDGTTDCRHPIWVVASGWSFYILALTVAVVIIIRAVIHQAEYGLLKKLTNSIKPDRNWGPRDPLINSQWKRNIEKQSGVILYSATTITLSRRLKVEGLFPEGEQEVDSSISNSNPTTSKTVTVVPVSNYKRRYDEHGLSIEF